MGQRRTAQLLGLSWWPELLFVPALKLGIEMAT